jgi:hypothetical protein
LYVLIILCLWGRERIWIHRMIGYLNRYYPRKIDCFWTEESNWAGYCSLMVESSWADYYSLAADYNLVCYPLRKA